jgi:phosphoribosylformylglycinamidine synthase
MLGVLVDVSKRVTPFFKSAGDVIVRVRTAKPSLAASEYAALFSIDDGGLGPIDLERENALIQGLVAGAELGLIRSAHDVSEGGLAVTIAEACFNSAAGLGAEIDTPRAGLTDAAELFGEGASTVILSVTEADLGRVEQLFTGHGLEFESIGRVTAEPLLKIVRIINEDVRELMQIYEDAIPRRLRLD